VTLQENNHIVIIDLVSGAVVASWSAGTTTHAADLKEDGVIAFEDTLTDARREPDAIVWTLGGRLVTANEGDYDLDLDADAGQFSGGRDFTVYSWFGGVLFEPGASLEKAAAAAGFYDDERSANKGIEVEGVAVATYGDQTYLFTGSERGNFVAVYDFDAETSPSLLQVLASGVSPEGLLAIPNRDLFVASNEVSGTLTIYELR
jgi:hypothetical protein